jgi:hypothetical protein
MKKTKTLTLESVDGKAMISDSPDSMQALPACRKHGVLQDSEPGWADAAKPRRLWHRRAGNNQHNGGWPTGFVILRSKGPVRTAGLSKS